MDAPNDYRDRTNVIDLRDTSCSNQPLSNLLARGDSSLLTATTVSTWGGPPMSPPLALSVIGPSVVLVPIAR
ncbi:hypothetical protein TNIN_214201 [Trichonephila inaurata madagascariensis]|uniref:Uncharacterized protein n=1 Tax=Trichonephila inaurata madagascariensis TaxID=2747483 RepID=A0A8X6YYD9_9ARAC|nr:hypothetical protein TNIN_214201 [Trichonephila inaurata madagascariensis]